MKQKQPPKPGLFGLLMGLLTLFGSPTVAHAQDSPARANWKSWEQQLRYDAIYTSDGEYETEMGEDGHKMYHVEVAYAEPYIWHAVIYNDIGEVYNYRTVRVAPWAISRQPTLQDISFADCSSNTAGTNAYAWISIDLADACFAGNNNLEGVYMKYKMYAGDDHTIMLKPKDVRPGKNIFWNNIKPKIYVDWEYYQDFINDSKWSEYKYQIVATTSMREAEKTMKGVGYARDHVEDGRGSFKTESGYSKTISYAHVIGASESDIRNVNGDILIYNDYGESAPFIITRIWSHAYDGSSALKSVKFQDVYKGKSYKDMNITIGDAAFANCPNLLTFDLVMKNNDTGGMQELTPANIKIGKHVFDGSPNVQIRVPLAQKAAFEADENWKEYAHLFVPYVEDITKSDFVEDGVRYNYIYDNNGNYVTTKVSDSKDGNHTLYHVKAKSVDNVKESIVFYNDIGTAWNYRTMLIDNDALNGRTGVKTVSFADCVSNIAGTNAWVWPTFELGKTSMMNCSSLEELQMKYKMYAGDDHAIMLRPGTVVPQSGFSLEGSPNAKILVDPEYYTSYINAPEWQGVKDRIVSTPKMREAEFKEYGMQYARDNNEDATGSYKTTTSNNGKTTVYKVHVIGPDADYIKNHDGIAYLYKDIGQTYAYTTTKIWSRSFDGCEDLKSVKIYDIMPSATKNYLDLNIEIGDSAFVNCPNLKFFDVVMNSVDEKDHFEVIHPSQMPIGKDAFAGSPNVRIRVAKKVYSEFLNDEKWSQYANLIEPYDFEMADYKEGGAVYSMWRTDDGQTYYCSKDSAEMEKIVEPWAAEFRNLEPEKLLALDSDKTQWYTHITGLDDDYLQKHDGELRIYNDIGTSYNFKTLAIDSVQLRGNENIKKIVFEDCASGSANTHTMLKMVIHNGAFKNCKNLKELNMFYLSTKGDNLMKSLTPSDVYIGENVFDGVSEDFRIVVDPELYSSFMLDANWSQYKDKIVATQYMPTVYSPIKHEGITYDYASNTLNSLPTSSLLRMQSSLWNIATIAVEVALIVATSGSASAASSASSSASAAPGFAAEVQSIVTPVETMYMYDDGSIAMSMFWGEVGEGVLSSAAATEAYWLGKAAAMTKLAILFGSLSAVEPTALGLTTGVKYLVDNIGKDIKRRSTWELEGGQWIVSEHKHTIYHMYIKDIDDKLEVANIYNDIGSAYNYRTVAIGKDAFHNKKNLKEVKFTDVNKGEMYEPLQITLPDSCFMGCDKLETINLIMRSNYTDRDVALSPLNIIPLGNHIFEGCDTTKIKIIVGKDVYEDFITDDYWSRFKNMFVAVDVPKKVDYKLNGTQYTYTFVDNSKKHTEEIGTHTIEHVEAIGPDLEEITSNNGVCVLTNDIGATYNYKLDRVSDKAFYNCDELEVLEFWDHYASLVATSHKELSIALGDSCFADCKNLREVVVSNLFHKRLAFKWHNDVADIYPDSLTLGKGVFDGCDKLKIKLPWNLEDAYLNDTTWAKYKDKFVPCLFYPKDNETLDCVEDIDGLRYETSVLDQTFKLFDASKYDKSKAMTVFKKSNIGSFEEFRTFAACGLDKIDEECFTECKYLKLITLPKTLKTIGARAFNGCESLNDLAIPENVSKVESEAFKGCKSMNRIYFNSPTPPALSGTGFFDGMPTDYVIMVADSVVDAYKSAWPQYANHIQTYRKPSGFREVTLTEPGTLAEKLGLEVTDDSDFMLHGYYSDIDSLKVNGPINGTDIGVIRCLGGRDVENSDPNPAGKLTYLDLYNADIKKGGATYNRDGDNDYVQADNRVDTYMFSELNLSTVILPKSATSIEDHAFYACPSLQRIVVGENVERLDNKVIYQSPNVKELIMLCNKKPETHKKAFDEDYHVTAIYVPRKLVTEYSSDFAYYNRTDTVIVAFEDENLEQHLREKGFYTISDLLNANDIEGLLDGNKNIQKFNELLYCGAEELGDNSLSGCSSLQEVRLPFGLKHITAGAFKGCSSLGKIKTLSGTIPTIETDAFADLPDNFLVYVPSDSVNAYRNAWPQYADHIVCDRTRNDNITTVVLTEAGTLAEKLGMEVVMEPDDPRNIKEIRGDYTKITALKVVGPINAKDIAVLRFLGGRDVEWCDFVALSRMYYLDLYDANICKDENKIYYNRYLKNDCVENDNEIPRDMFWKCDNINTLILPKSVTKINYEACYDMLYLENVVIGDNTVEIDEDVFGECPKLKKIAFMCNTKPKLDGDAFSDPVSDQPYHVENFYVPKGLLSQYTSDYEYVTHANGINTEFDDDDMFRECARRLIFDKDDFSKVHSLDGWFKDYVNVTDLSQLRLSNIDTLKTEAFSALANLKRIVLPNSLTEIQANVFANNGNLAWADFTRCSEAGGSLAANADKLGAAKSTLVYMPSTFGSSEKANVVYGAEGARECARYELTDSRDYEVPMEFTAKAISYDRDFKKRTAPYTTCLPFDCDVPAGCKAYTLSGRSDNALIFTQVADMKGEKPYLIIAEAADAKIEQTSDVKIPVTPLRLPQVNAPGYSMLGTLSYIDNEQAAGMKAYVLQPDAQWHPVSNDGKSNIAPYRAFIQVNGTRATRAIQSWFEDVDGTTGATVLKTIDFDGKERYYDLNGRQLNGAPKHGVYIHNGKKVVGY